MILHIGIAVIFLLAVAHTFATPQLHQLALRYRQLQVAEPYRERYYSSMAQFLQLLSEIEIVFGIWLIPLFMWSSFFMSLDAIKEYVITREYTFAIYITVIVVVVSSRPIISFMEKLLEFLARLGSDRPGAWWLTIMTIGPLLSSVLKEPGAMALSAILLMHKFYAYKPSSAFQYATLGLLFANVSVSGLLIPYSSRALFFAVSEWNWDFSFVIATFGWRLLIGIAVINLIYFFVFRKNFRQNFPSKLPAHEKEEMRKPTPFWLTLVHLIFTVSISLTSQHAPLFFALFLLFLAFHQITRFYQGKLMLKKGALAGFFFASLVLHGELQGFWLLPLLQDFGEHVMAITSFVLSAFADNAIVNYLGVELTNLTPKGQYILVASTMSAGGLTVIASIANPIGLRILRQSFHGEISLFKLFLGGLLPGLFYWAIFILI